MDGAKEKLDSLQCGQANVTSKRGEQMTCIHAISCLQGCQPAHAQIHALLV